MINSNKPSYDTETSPVFICDINGSFVSANKRAEESAHVSLLKTNIARYISSEDALRYDFIMKCKKPRPFIAAAKLVCGNGFLCIFPSKISDCRIAIVVVKKSKIDAEDLIANCDFNLNNNMQLLLDHIDAFKSSCYTNALFDAQKAAELITSKITAEGLTHLSFNVHAPEDLYSSEAFLCDFGLDCFVSIFTSVVFAFGAISTSSQVDIALSAMEGSFGIAFETDCDEGFDINKDSFSKSIDFLRFAFESSSCSFDASTEGCKIKVACTFSDIADNIDFKSNDPFADFDTILQKSVELLASIYKAEDREEE